MVLKKIHYLVVGLRTSIGYRIEAAISSLPCIGKNHRMASGFHHCEQEREKEKENQDGSQSLFVT